MKKIIFLCLAALYLSSCGTSKSSTASIGRIDQYPKMYAESPVSIVVMPPINQTNHVEAKDYFYTTLYAPLCEK